MFLLKLQPIVVENGSGWPVSKNFVGEFEIFFFGFLLLFPSAEFIALNMSVLAIPIVPTARRFPVPNFHSKQNKYTWVYLRL